MGLIKDFLTDRSAAAIGQGVISVGTMSSGMEIALPYLAVRGAKPQ